ncbi:asparagine synthase (glutamine-hydrolyzing) [Candidatus Woesearchaeota archaeon]|nr:MAG: asparagine synthase (glutamine-hydrolyzing) [Candidatus Woesearchaeota archaeon]
MCGITGIIKLEGTLSTEEKEKIQVSMKALHHRGPDAQNVFFDTATGMGHCRLSIIDTSNAANQPMESFDRKHIIVFNGEIYNYKELKHLLKEYPFQTQSDTEVILAAYRAWGPACVNKFRGMWALCIFDKEKNSFFLSRDRIGEKPLVYLQQENNVYFASELPVLLKLLPEQKKLTLNVAGVEQLFLYNQRHLPWNTTIYKEVFKLPPGHNLIVQEGKLHLQQYYRQKHTKKQQPYEVAEAAYEQVIQKAVSRCQESDVPLGMLMSGGVDAATVASHLTNKSIIGYTIGFSKHDPEILRAKKIAEKIGMHHETILLSGNKTRNKFVREYASLIAQFGEPLVLFPTVYTKLIMQEIRKKGIVVVLTGNGADELFYGYDGSNKLLLVSRILEIVDKQRMIKNLLSVLAPLGIFSDNIRDLIGLAQEAPYRRKGYFYRKHAALLRKTLFSKPMASLLAHTDPGEHIDAISKTCAAPFIDAAQWAGLRMENEHSLTLGPDTGSMCCATELRSPFLDADVISFAASLPAKYKVSLRRIENKKIVKKALAKRIGKQLTYQKKQGFGFGFPIAQLLRTEWKKEFLNYLEESLKMELFQKDEVTRQCNDFMNGGRRHEKNMVTLFTLGIWYKHNKHHLQSTARSS